MRLGYKTAIVMLAIMLLATSFLQHVGGRVYGADFAGAGTSGNPYIIQTAAQLDKVRDYLDMDVYFRLTNDIDLSGYGNWLPIGDSIYPFAGSFDGGGHTITGLTISAPEGEYVGLFGYTYDDSIISDLNVEEAEIEGMFAVGGLVGFNIGVIRNSSFSGEIRGEGAVGGLVGYNLGVSIENSHATGTVHGGYAVGGLVGKSTSEDTIITGSSSGSAISSPRDSEEIGGLIGNMEFGMIMGSSASGAVTGGNRSTQVGGLAGRISDTSIHDSAASGDVSGRSQIGGLVGNHYDSSISDSHATGNVRGNFRVGGLIGSNIRGTIDDSHATGVITGTSRASSIGGLIGDDAYGIIRNSHASGDVIGDGESDSAGGLIGNSQDGHINGSSASGDVRGNWLVGGLIGSLNGNGQVESSMAKGNVYGLLESNDVGGLIGDNRGVIRDSYALGDVSTDAGTMSYKTGGLIGSNNGDIHDSFAAGQVSGQYMAGGLIGYHIDALIQGSFASGNVSGVQNIGGLLGYHVNSTVIDSYASGDVHGDNIVGGLVATIINATVSKSYASGIIHGNDFVGGLISNESDLTVVNSFYDSEASGVSVSAGGVGKQTAEMQSIETFEADTANGWDFSNVWAIDSAYNGGYPYLRNVQVFLDFDDNGATGGSVPDTRSYMPGTEIVIDEGDDPVIRADYMLAGWNTQADGNGATYLSGDVYIVTSNATLYAMWLAISSDATLTSSIGTVSEGGTANETITDVPYGTTLAELRAAITPAAYATFELYAADGTTLATTLTSGTQIIVTAQDGSTRVTYTVSIALSNEKELTAFSLPQQTGAAVIDAATHTVEIEVDYGTDLSNLVATFTSSIGSSVRVNGVVQASGTTVNDFTAPVIYEVRAADGSEQDWTVTVTVAPSNEKEMISFSLSQQTGAAVIDAAAHTVEIEVAYGTNLSNLIATFTSSIGSSVRVNGVVQASGTTVNDFTAPVIYEVRAADGSTQDWTVTVTVAPSNEKELISFSLPQQTGAAVIDAAAHTVEIEVTYGTNLINLIATFTSSIGSSVRVNGVSQVSGTTANNFTSSVVYEVRAADGSTQDWTVTVTVAPSDEKELLSFSLTQQTGTAVIDAAAHTVEIEVVYGTNLSNLIATFTSSIGSSVRVNGVVQASGTTVNDFTAPVIYEVRAADGSEQDWTVTVTVAPSNEKELISFSLSQQTGMAVIDTAAHTVEIEVAYGTNLINLIATFTSSIGSSVRVNGVAQISGTTANNFTSSVVYEVRAADGSTQYWTVTVTLAPSNEKELISFSLSQQTGAAVIDAAAHTVEIEVDYGTDLSNLVATFTSSADSSVSVNGVSQISGTTVNDFVSPVVYEVHAVDGSTQDWTITVTVAPSDEKELLSFSLSQQTGAAVIDAAAHTVEIEVAYGTNLSNLIATFTSSIGSSVRVNGVVQASGTTANNFTSPVTYTVTAQDGTLVTYTVTAVVRGLPALSELTLSAGGVVLNADSIIGTVFRYRVGNPIAAINVKASASNSDISIAGYLYDSDNQVIGGPIDFISGEESLPLSIEVGDNRLELVVTDAHGASQTYQINVYRIHAGYSNAQLHVLQLSGNLLQYERNRLEYSVTVGNQVNRVTITAVPDETGSFVRINDENTTSRDIALATGQNIIVIRVTAEDGTTMQTYRITITRASIPATGTGGGGGPIGPVTSGYIDAKQGGALTLLDVRIDAPANTMDGLIHVTVNPIDDPSVHPSGSALISKVYEITKNTAGFFNKKVTITIPFDKSKVDFTTASAGLYGLDSKSGEWVLLDNQVVDIVNGTVSGDAYDFATYAILKVDNVSEPPVETSHLTDIAGHWAETNIREFIQSGALQGYPDNTFRPNAPITRAEFVRVLVGVLNLQTDSGSDFTDVQTHWARDEIRIAAALGIVNGYNDGTFAPDDYITREQMAVIIVRALRMQQKDAVIDFKDDADISDWARQAISTVVAYGILNGYEDGTMQPASRATRAEAVTVIVRALQLD